MNQISIKGSASNTPEVKIWRIKLHEREIKPAEKKLSLSQNFAR